LNVLHISSATTWRGGERQVKFLLDGLTAKDVAVSLMSPIDSALASRSGLTNSQLIPFRKGLFSLWQNIRTLKGFCSKNKIDIIHGHDSHAHTLLWMAYRLGGLKTKSVVTRRLINPIKSRSFKKYNDARIEKIICISDAVRKVLAPSISNPSRLEVIHSGIDIRSQRIDRADNEEKNEFVVGYVAAFTEEKDHETFLATAEYLINTFPEDDYHFLLIGGGPLINKIKTKAEKINGKFTFTGFIKNVDQAYANMDVLLHTSKSEALGTAILDAMKHGVVTVATNIGGIPEIINHDKSGFLCQRGDFKDFAQKVHLLKHNLDVKKEIVENAYLKLNQFDKSVMIKKTLAIYKKVLQLEI